MENREPSKKEVRGKAIKANQTKPNPLRREIHIEMQSRERRLSIEKATNSARISETKQKPRKTQMRNLRRKKVRSAEMGGFRGRKKWRGKRVEIGGEEKQTRNRSGHGCKEAVRNTWYFHKSEWCEMKDE